jgi:hypothetical protein
MSAAEEHRVPLGTVMREAGLITEAQLEHALSVQESTGRPLGEIIVTLGYASSGAVANALAEQYGGMLRTEYGVSPGFGGQRAAAPAPEPEPQPEQAHFLLVPSAGGHMLIRREGACPSQGSQLADATGRAYVVTRVGESPLGDGLRCACLEPAP